MAHIKHLGFELELKVEKIFRSLSKLPPQERQVIVDQLQPAGLRRAVADMLHLETH